MLAQLLSPKELRESFVYNSFSQKQAFKHPRTVSAIGFPATYVEPNEEKTSWKVRFENSFQMLGLHNCAFNLILMFMDYDIIGIIEA